MAVATMVRDEATIKVPNMAGAPNPIERDEGEERLDNNEQVKGIVSRLEQLATEQVTAKDEIEQRWLRNLRAFHGVYDPDTEKRLKDSKKSRAFVKATRAKELGHQANSGPETVEGRDRGHQARRKRS